MQLLDGDYAGIRRIRHMGMCLEMVVGGTGRRGKRFVSARGGWLREWLKRLEKARIGGCEDARYGG